MKRFPMLPKCFFGVEVGVGWCRVWDCAHQFLFLGRGVSDSCYFVCRWVSFGGEVSSLKFSDSLWSDGVRTGKQTFVPTSSALSSDCAAEGARGEKGVGGNRLLFLYMSHPHPASFSGLVMVSPTVGWVFKKGRKKLYVPAPSVICW